jgi:hypothetical protein
MRYNVFFHRHRIVSFYSVRALLRFFSRKPVIRILLCLLAGTVGCSYAAVATKSVVALNTTDERVVSVAGTDTLPVVALNTTDDRVVSVAGTDTLPVVSFTTTGDSIVSVAGADTLPVVSFTTKQADQPLILHDVCFDNYACGETPGEMSVYIHSRVGENLTISSLTLTGDSAAHFILSNSGGTTIIPAMPGVNDDWRIQPVAGLNAGIHTARLVLAYMYNDSVCTATADVYLMVDKIKWNLNRIRGVFDESKTRAQQLHLNIVGAPPGATLAYYYGLNPAPGNPRSLVDNDGKTSFTFTDSNGLQPASTYPIGVIAEADQNHYASTDVRMLGKGHTAYATPIFSDVFTISYTEEQLTLNPGYLSGEATGPYYLTTLLDALTKPGFMFSIVHKAEPEKPFPASRPGFSDMFSARPDAPAVDTVIHASDSAGSNGEIRITGRSFEYISRDDPTAYWKRVTEVATDLPAGDYDVRFPADEAEKTFASHLRLVTVSHIPSPSPPPFTPAVLARMMTQQATLNGQPDNGTYGNPVPVLYNERITCKITAVNANLHAGGELIIRDTLPPYLNYIDGTATNATVINGDIADTPIGGEPDMSVLDGMPQRIILQWRIANLQPFDTVVVYYKVTPEKDAATTQTFFINRAWVCTSDTIFTPTNATCYQGAGVITDEVHVTFSALAGGGVITPVVPQALHYRSSPHTDEVHILPDSGYRFAGWQHDAYTSLHGEPISADSGIMRLDSLVICGNVELYAHFVALDEPSIHPGDEASIPPSCEKRSREEEEEELLLQQQEIVMRNADANGVP